MDNNKTRKAKCPNGTRRDPKTGECVPIAELEAKKKRRTKKNKEDNVVVTEEAKEASVINNPNPSGIELAEDNEILIPAEEKEEKEEEKKEDKSVFENMLSSVGLSSKPNSEKENSKETNNEEEEEQEEEEEEKEENDDYDEEENEKHLSENEIAKENEKFEYDFWKKDETNEDIGFLYPTLNDPKFNIKIASKKEFQNQRFDGTIYDDIEAKAKEECESSFEILPHQQFVRNFMSTNTPYNSLLLYHELGTGKTCSAIGITEEMRNYSCSTRVN
jgi:hypothetical protein